MKITRIFASKYSVVDANNNVLFSGTEKQCIEFLKSNGVEVGFYGDFCEKIRYIYK